MTIETLGDLGDFVGGIAVIVSLVYLALQIRQNTRMLRASALSATTETYVSFNHLLGSDPLAARVFQVGLEDFSTLDDLERRQFMNLMRAAIISYEHVYQNYEAGLIDAEVWERYLLEAKRLIQMPHISTWWRARKHAYTNSFVEMLDRSPEVPEQKLANRIIDDMLAASRFETHDSVPPS